MTTNQEDFWDGTLDCDIGEIFVDICGGRSGVVKWDWQTPFSMPSFRRIQSASCLSGFSLKSGRFLVHSRHKRGKVSQK
jgi:hypothetical protein